MNNITTIKSTLNDIISGEWGDEASSEKAVNILRTTNFTNDGIIDYTDVVKREIKESKVIQKRLLKGDIIIEKSGGSPNQPVGRVVYFEKDSAETFLCNNFTSVLRPKTELCSKYLFYYLFNNYRKGLVLRYQNKTTGIINLKLDRYLDEKVYLPSTFEKQKRIADILDKADSLRKKRRQTIDQCDEFLKSTFLDMFGDPIIDNRWKMINMGEVIDVLTDYHANGSYEILRNHVKLTTEKDYALMVRTTDLENNEFEKGVNYITQEAYFFLKKTKVFGGEIIVNKIGSAGKVYLMPSLNRPVSLGMNAFLLRFNKQVNNIFIYYMLTSSYGSMIINKKVKGAVTKTIRKDAIRDLKIPLPPLPQQQKFASIVGKTEALKQKMQQQLKELDDNFNSLMQRAFKGEL